MKPYVFYPVVILILIVTLFEIFMVFDGIERARVKVRAGRTSKPMRGRKREDLSNDEWGKLKGEELLNKIEDKEEW